jgi:hypothetical protein
VGFAVLVVKFSFFGLAVDGLALNKLRDFPLPPTSLVDRRRMIVVEHAGIKISY